MSDTANKALLPAGLQDVLPPDAAFEAQAVERLMTVFAANGFERVKPPLIEFEETLLSGSGQALAGQTFRFMDPQSRRMLGVRADQTLQVARIAATRLINRPRPLRLSYAGQVLRVKGSQLRPERQFAQAGFELIGAPSVEADAEAILVAVDSLKALGVKDITVDINLPILASIVFEDMNVPDEERGRLREALAHKDVAYVGALGGRAGDVLAGLIGAVGPADIALKKMANLGLSGRAEEGRLRLVAVWNVLKAEAPELSITLDPVEHRGFEYHTGVSFALFAKGASGDLGRGGRYTTGDGETATGATLFMDTVLKVTPKPESVRRVFLPLGTARSEALRLQKDGWVTICGLDSGKNSDNEAARLGCGHVFRDGNVVERKA